VSSSPTRGHEEASVDNRVPATIITGFLGSGKVLQFFIIMSSFLSYHHSVKQVDLGTTYLLSICFDLYELSYLHKNLRDCLVELMEIDSF
jgi:hypothetical protein